MGITKVHGVANGDLLYNTENSTWYSVIIYVGKESEREWMCVYVFLSPFVVAEIITTLSINYTSIKLKKKKSTVPQIWPTGLSLPTPDLVGRAGKSSVLLLLFFSPLLYS